MKYLFEIFLAKKNHLAALLLVGTVVFFPKNTAAVADKFRCMWRDDPATTAIIGWNQLSGNNPVFYYDLADRRQEVAKYAMQQKPDKAVLVKGMSSNFVRLKGLKPNTSYFFVVKDSEGTSQRLFFTTAPADPNQRIAIIAGGDSRNQRTACREANKLVAKLRAHCVLFGGDMTTNDEPLEWQQWLNDWQLTIASDGRMTPIVVSRGNHEQSNQILVDLFDVAAANIAYSFSIGGNLLRIYTLNSMMPPGGEQKIWLENDLKASKNALWKIAQFHYPMMPHSSTKPKQIEQIIHWAPLFQQYKMNVGIECDAHVVKMTQPIRASTEAGSSNGFIKDEKLGTTYIGEGCWGAPLRRNDLNYPWTCGSGSFNHFNLLWIDKNKIEIRTVKTENSDAVKETNNPFELPDEIELWSSCNGEVTTLLNVEKPAASPPVATANNNPNTKIPATPNKPKPEPTATPEAANIQEWETLPKIIPDAKGVIGFKYVLDELSNVAIRLLDPKMNAFASYDLPSQKAGDYAKAFNISTAPKGKYLLLVRGNKKVVTRFFVVK